MNNCKDKLCQYYNENYSYNCTYTSNEENCVKAIKARSDSKNMNDKRVIFESEEDAVSFFKLFFGIGDIGIYEDQRLMGIKDIIARLKNIECIRKNPVEEAEEKWNNIKKDNQIDFSGEYLRRLNFADEYIELLKHQISELKK